jgi:hypothetical protein
MEGKMATSNKATKNAQITRIRDRNQITLSGDFLTAMDASVGDFLECRLMDEGYMVLAPTRMESRLVRLDSPEAEEANKKAEEDIAQGRYTTFNSAKEFEENLLGKKAGAKKASYEDFIDPAAFAEIQTVMRASGGNVRIAAKKLGVPAKGLATAVKILHHAGAKKV